MLQHNLLVLNNYPSSTKRDLFTVMRACCKKGPLLSGKFVRHRLRSRHPNLVGGGHFGGRAYLFVIFTHLCKNFLHGGPCVFLFWLQRLRFCTFYTVVLVCFYFGCSAYVFVIFTHLCKNFLHGGPRVFLLLWNNYLTAFVKTFYISFYRMLIIYDYEAYIAYPPFFWFLHTFVKTFYTVVLVCFYYCETIILLPL